MEAEPLERARRRLAEARGQNADPAAFAVALERARAMLETLAERTAELEATVPERLEAAVQESIRGQVSPVGRHVAEVRGLANQTIRRLERLQGDVAGERSARVEDLAVVVDLVASGWRGIDARLDRLERAFDRLERSLEAYAVTALHPEPQDSAVAGLYRLDEHTDRSPHA
jgi:hypothetical protein